MADRPRRSGLTQRFAVPDEDDIYDDPSIALLEDASGPAEETHALITNYIDSNQDSDNEP